ncbi:hypothetical protein SLEP1_g29153 [Rubroshorea leprosula]|uniref:DUF4283 domain-containing protein n=1 Tax=Rubroshorea leprosula TaxID=152421 RepID=A0AAV5K6C0_9ROSI|nr:hypothetical protein SLEP1_g29153 [Rubroshorea leprosula]
MAISNALSLIFPSSQENDLLAWSVKRVKNVNSIVSASTQEEHMAKVEANPLSYTDKLLCDGSTKSSDMDLSFDAFLEYLDEESAIDDDLDDPTPIILFSKEEKKHMREPWKNALIIKTSSKTVGYNFLYGSLKTQWKLASKWDCIDLGYDFFLVRFQVHEDLNKVINGSPWFVGTNYLTIRPWEPNFKLEIATFLHTVVWAQLSSLSAKYYDLTSLQRISNSIGTLQRMDAHTAHHTHGQYARVCVRIDLDKPLFKLLRLGKICQKVVYEGSKGLCFACGPIGHRKEPHLFLLNFLWRLVMNKPMVASPTPQLSPNLKVLLVNNNHVISMEEALELMLSREKKTHPLWKERDLFKSSCNPLLTLKSIDLNPLALKEDQTVLIDQCKVLKLESTFEQPGIEEKKGPYPTFEIPSSSMVRESPNFRNNGQNGEDPCYRQVLNPAQNDGDGLRLPDAFVPHLGGLNDVDAQGNYGANLLSWNCRDVAKFEFKRHITDLKNQHAPSIMLILKTKLSGQDVKEVATNCGFPCIHVVDSDGKAGGLWLLWDDVEACVDVITSTFQSIHAIVKAHDLTFLDNSPTEKEIQDALFELKPFKALGPYGLHLGFFQRMWDSMRSTLCSGIGNIFSSTSIPTDWNECLITLIPKIKAPEIVQQF